MKFFIDSGDLARIREIADVYPIHGITTNPKILVRIGEDLTLLMPKYRSLAEEKDLQIFFQVTAKRAEEMVSQAEKLRLYFGDRLIVKIPAIREGYKAVRLCAENSIPTAVTAIHSILQATIAASAGAAYVAPYISHIDSIGADSVACVAGMIKAFQFSGTKCEVLGASFRTVNQVKGLELAGCHAATISPELFDSLIAHPSTDAAMAGFERIWTETYGTKEITDFLPGNLR